MSNHENELYIEARYEEYLKEGYTPTVALEFALRDFNNTKDKENEDEFIDFDKMDNSQKLAFLTERNGYIEDGIGLDDTGNEFRDDNGQALFIDNEENEDA